MPTNFASFYLASDVPISNSLYWTHSSSSQTQSDPSLVLVPVQFLSWTQPSFKIRPSLTLASYHQ